MGLLRLLFRPSWWNDTSFTTAMFTRRHGQEVGRDEVGNLYFQHKKDARRRWVTYSGANDASRVPPGWTSWLRGQIDDIPDKSLPPRRAFEQPAQANVTGTENAYRPSGSLSRGGERPAATGDYQAWTPE